ncbi:unnamed protein product [Staurois parvus]|uniref:Uncharacterized protein n=1 Tax=Staurois parvus TaxID=386267 RepID=A0ABN9DII8_9NEOB|nr:unnamed protein product [Staurois parvus]
MRLFCVPGAHSPPSSRAAAPKVRTLQLAQQWANYGPADLLIRPAERGKHWLSGCRRGSVTNSSPLTVRPEDRNGAGTRREERAEQR